VKGLTVKNKSEKTGPRQGLLLTLGKSGGAVEALDGKLLGAKLEEMLLNNGLEELENTPEEDADPTHHVLKVRDTVAVRHTLDHEPELDCEHAEHTFMAQ
jgi:hypothetical protein